MAAHLDKGTPGESRGRKATGPRLLRDAGSETPRRTLRPPGRRTGDLGRDLVATKAGVGSIRIFDQVKAYKPGHVVTADEVRSLIGVLTGAQNVSEGVVTTTSTFAPRLEDVLFIRSLMPYRLELKPRDKLLAWLEQLSAQR